MTNPSPHNTTQFSSQSDLVENCNFVASRHAVDSIQHLNQDHLLEIQSLLEQGDTFGHWTLPTKWLIGDNRSQLALRNLNIKDRLTSLIPTDLVGAALQPLAASNSDLNLVEFGVLQITRLLIILRLTNVQPTGGRSKKPLHPRTVRQIGKDRIIPMVARSIIELLRNPDDIELSPRTENLLCFYTGKFDSELSPGIKRSIKKECIRLQTLHEHGLWGDVPNPAVVKISKAMRQPALYNNAPAVSLRHLPLPDEYVAEMGSKCVWILRNIAPRITGLLNQVSDAWLLSIQHSDDAQKQATRRSRLIRKIIQGQKRADECGGIFPLPPFRIDISSKYTVEQLFSGDIKSTDKGGFLTPIMNVARLVQQASLFILALSSAARRSELMSLNRSLLVDERRGRSYAEGKLFKNAVRVDGDVKTWILPDIPLFALTRQVDLGTAIDRLAAAKNQTLEFSPSEESETKPLWIQITDGSNIGHLMFNAADEFGLLAQSLGMNPQPSGQNFRPHRFRPTMARLLGLAISEAPTILMEIFGHEHIDSTLYYFLSNPKLRAEAEKVVREQRVLKAKKIIDEIHLDTELNPDGSISKHSEQHGGRGAMAIRRAVEESISATYRRGETWGITDAMELAELLTLNGTSWMYVRRGVVCTKLPGETGPCNRNKGAPEPSNCAPSCNHRFEESFLFDDVDQAIEDCVKYYHVDLHELLIRGRHLLPRSGLGTSKIKLGQLPSQINNLQKNKEASISRPLYTLPRYCLPGYIEVAERAACSYSPESTLKKRASSSNS